jgi:DNA-binding NarL/FixJ family response regulator
LIADDHEVVRRGLVAIIKAHPDWEVCDAECANGTADSNIPELRQAKLEYQKLK